MLGRVSRAVMGAGGARPWSTMSVADVDLLAVTEDQDEAQLREERLQKKRNKSKLSPWHRDFMNRVPPADREMPHQSSLPYRRKMFGTYGFQSGEDPGICWMTAGKFKNQTEYEKVAYDKTLLEMVEIIKENKRLKEEEYRKREELILYRMSKLDQWKEELRKKMAKKEQIALATKAKKEKLIEEVRRHFGFKIDPKDERFQTLLAEKEKQQKKAEKQAKKSAKEAQMILNLQKKNAEIQ